MMVSPRIKMCGMTQADDIAFAAELGVDAIGLIFYPQSKRAVSIQKAEIILKKIPVFMDIVAVFVNPSVVEVKDVLAALPIQWLQFHGDEEAHFCAQFAKPYIKSIAVHNPTHLREQVRLHHQATAILLDTPTSAYGGSGCTFDWQLIPVEMRDSIILAGGLNHENIVAAIKAVRPKALDICSGIEKTPGIKDHRKMRLLMQAVGGLNEPQ